VVGVTGVVVGHVSQGEDVSQPAALRRVELLVEVVRGHRQDVDARELEHVPRAHEVIGVRQLLLHGSRSEDHGVRPPAPFDVLFGEVVVVGMREQDVVGPLVVADAPGIDEHLQAGPSDADRRAAEPGDARQQFVHASGG
jgi:hypothetical protein